MSPLCPLSLLFHMCPPSPLSPPSLVAHPPASGACFSSKNNIFYQYFDTIDFDTRLGLRHGFNTFLHWQISQRRRRRLSSIGCMQRCIYPFIHPLINLICLTFPFKVPPLFSVEPRDPSIPLLAQATISFSMVANHICINIFEICLKNLL